MLIVMDWPLGLTALVFFSLSFAYGQAMLVFFEDRFVWDLASVVGITSVVSCTYVGVWIGRLMLDYPPIQVLEQPVWDLFVIFLAALPGMTMHRIKLTNQRQARRFEIENSLTEIKTMAEHALIQRESMESTLKEILAILKLRAEAIEYFRNREHFRN